MAEAILAEGAVLQTRKGYVHIEEFDNETPVLTEKGFQNVIVEPINYQGQLVQFILWGYPDWIYVASDTIAVGTTYNRCMDLGGLGICRPHNRCWNQCPDNHPNKEHFKHPKELSFRQIRKRSHVVIPSTCAISYSHRDKNKCFQKFFQSGFQFSRQYKEKPETIPCIDLEYILYSDPLEWKSFVLGWQEGMAQTKLDMWNYFFILKNKQLAYQTQFLLNYFGIPCAMEPYHSSTHGQNNWAVIWCKNKKAFHYKSFPYHGEFRCQVKKWTPMTTDEPLIQNKKWFVVKPGKDNDAKYFAAPFYFKYEGTSEEGIEQDAETMDDHTD